MTCSRTLVDEVVVDADVAQRPRQGAHAGTDRRAEQRNEEQQAEQQAPERAAQSTRAGEVVQLTGLGLLLALLPTPRWRRRTP